MWHKRIHAFPVLMVVAGLACGPVFAQSNVDSFPSKPVTIIIPYVGTVALDTEIRLYTQSILESTGKQFINDFRGGAGTTIGAAFVAKAPPDGYTLLASNSPFTIAPFVYPSLPYDNARDFAPISLLSQNPLLLLSGPDAPYKNIVEYIAYARAHPGAINFGTAGQGVSAHLVGEWLHHDTATKVTFIHYKTANQRMLDLIAGRVDITGAGVAASTGFLKSGKMRALAVTSKRRVAAIPDIPTVSEQLLPGFDFSTWVGVFAPARTAPAIIGRLNTMFVKATKDPNAVRKLEIDGTFFIGSTPEQFREYLAAETERWRKLIADVGIKLEAE